MTAFPHYDRFTGRHGLRWLVFCCCILLLSPAAFAQTGPATLQTPVSISGNDIPMSQVLKAIRKQTGLTPFYSNQLLNDKEKIGLNFNHAPLEAVLDYLFKNKPVSYEIRGNRLLLNERTPAVKEPPATPQQSLADSIRVKGQVMDPDGRPLVDATVVLKGKPGHAAKTDELGIFSLIAAPGDILSISMVGMQSEEITVPAKGLISLTLHPRDDKMNEAVVVGYGQQRKITVTGSIATVNMEDMQMPVRNLTDALAGKVAGVISVQSSGEPGYDNSTFTIRGIGTFTGNVSPLIIVDGVQREDVNSTYGGAYNNIDPEDIASISLLKDASATAVYGAKAANGVLIITTKRGVAGKPKVAVKFESGVSGLTKVPKMLDGVNYMRLYNEARTNDGEAPVYSDATIQKTASGLDPYLYPNVDWIHTIYKDWAPYYNGNVNVTGGGEATRYFLSMSFYDQDGSYKVSNLNGYNPNLNFKRYDFRSNVDVNITKTTLLSLNLDAMLVGSRYPGVSAAKVWYGAFSTNPIVFPIKYPGGLWAGPVNNGGVNPFNQVQNSGYTTEFHPTVQSVLTLNQKLDGITRGLSALGRFSFDSYSETDIDRTGTNDLWYAGSRDGEGNLVLTQSRVGSTFLGYSTSTTAERTIYLEGNVNYARSFGDHNIGALLVYNMRNRIVGSATTVTKSIPYRNQATAGRLTYSYKDKYLAEFDGGYTGSENFAPGHRWGFFPSVSAGWVISKENFFDPLASTFSLLKLRASRGLVGNDNIGDGSRFGYLTQINPGGTTAFGTSPTIYGGIQASVIGTDNLTWERSTKTDVGLEIGIRNKLNIVIDAYQDRRRDILIARQTISSIAGFSGYNYTAGTGNTTVYTNLGEMNNEGIDGSVEYKGKLGKSLGLRVYGNFTYAHNKIVFEDEPMRKYPWMRATGTKYNEFYGYQSQGLFQDQNDIAKSPVQTLSTTINPGDIKYRDLNGDGVIDAYDVKYLGKSSFPNWSYGAGFSISYKKFDVSMLFQGVTGVGIMANGAAISVNDAGASGVGVIPFAGVGQFPASVLNNVMNRWTVNNPSQHVDYPRLNIGASPTSNNYSNSTWWLKDGAYTRLKQASIGYTLSNARWKAAGIGSLYLYLAGTNLLTFSKFKLWDPELGSDGAGYPPVRTVVAGIRANF
jgi:TonB-linked SusC/RagA family outer membrane protein